MRSSYRLLQAALIPEKAAGVNVTINLSNTNVQVGDAVELLIDGKPFYELYFARTNGAGDFSWNGDRDDCRRRYCLGSG